MTKEIAVVGCKLECTTGKGTVSILSLPNSNVKAGGKNTYCGQLTIGVTGYVDSTIEGASGTGIFKPNAQYIKIDGNYAVLKDAISEGIVVTGVSPEDSEVSVSKTIKVKIVDAGQTEVKGE